MKKGNWNCGDNNYNYHNGSMPYKDWWYLFEDDDNIGGYFV